MSLPVGVPPGDVAVDDRLSGAVEAARSAPLSAAAGMEAVAPASVDPSTGEPLPTPSGKEASELTGNGAAPLPLRYHEDPSCGSGEAAPTQEKAPPTAGRKVSSNGKSDAKAAPGQTDPAASSELPESPELTASWFSKIFFWWLNGIVTLGATRPLADSDMYQIPPEQDAHRSAERFTVEWRVELERREVDAAYEPSVTKALYRMFRYEYWLSGVLKAVMVGLQFLQPILQEWLLAFIVDSQYYELKQIARPEAWVGYVLAVVVGVNPFLTTVLSNTYFRITMKMGLQCRTILVTHLYRKSLRLSPAAKLTMSTGTIVNMMSTDTSKVDVFVGYIHYIWSALAQTIVAIALLLRAIGLPALAGVGVVLFLIPAQGVVMFRLQRLRDATVTFTDRRVKLMNEILQGVRVIKVYAWEGSFLAKLSNLRGGEMEFVRAASYTRAWNSTLMQIGPLLMILVSFIVLGLTSPDNFEAEFIFSSLTLFQLLTMGFMFFPMSLAFWSDANIGIKRMEKFLLADELNSEPEYVQTDEFAIKVDNADFAWEKVVAAPDSSSSSSEGVKVAGANDSLKDTAAAPSAATAAASAPAVAAGTEEQKQGEVEAASAQPLLASDGSAVASPLAADSAAAAAVASAPSPDAFHMYGVDFTIPKGSLTVVVGAVGAGKSSLLAGILGEMRRVRGKVQIAGSVGYCPQQAWIQNASLKDNILFGLPFDQHKYDEAIRTCALQADIDVLPARDATEIGEKGINLSGGQKQRVNLARAVYFDAEIIMLDDPLSAVDAHVSKYLFNTCICDKLRNKTRLLVTHQLQYVSACDNVLFVENGRISEQGTYQQLMRDKGKFFTLMSTYVGEEEDSDSEGEEASTATEEDVVAPGVGVIVPGAASLKSEKQSKKQRNRGLRTAGSNGSTAHGGDKHGVVLKKKKTLLHATDSDAAKKQALEMEKAAQSLMQSEERTHGDVPFSVYTYYIRQCGGWGLLFIFIVFLCAQTAASSWLTWWLGLWSNDEYGRSTYFYLGIYAGIGVAQGLFALVSTLVSAYMGIIAAVELHNASFGSVLRAPQSFFDTTPVGRIINRFSKDQDMIDSMLMDMLWSTIYMAMSVLATFVMIAVSTPIFLAPLAPILVLYYIVQSRYRRTSRELKRIESISRSPLFAHFSETLTGLATIRAYRAQGLFVRVNERRMDANNRAYYLLVLSNRWLSIRVETIGALIAFFAALFVVIQRDSISPGTAGVSLSYALSVTELLNWLVRQIVEAESGMNSVERSKFYTDSIEQEAPARVDTVDERAKEANWPQHGAIQFNDLQVRYRPGLPLVLHGVTLSIRGGERVGIVGRTGAGKSSLMVALFRIVEAAAGSILIDGQDISTLGLDLLRSKLAIIPQDPVLFSGTIRSNLDPFDQYTDAQLWSVLEKAYLKDTIAALELKLLDPVSDNGENMSVGQRCQMCLARAMLRNAKVLIMDEATASVDMETDSYIQTSLRSHFDCTLLTIAHRLNTICDYDRVLVLSFGRVEEFDTPANLLRNPNSHLSSMVAETGEVNAALLRQIAFKKEAGLRVDIVQALAMGDEHAGSPLAAVLQEQVAQRGGELGVVSPSIADVGERVRELSRRAEASQVRWHDPAAEDDEQ